MLGEIKTAKYFLIAAICLIISGCSSENTSIEPVDVEAADVSHPLFRNVPSSESGIVFNNVIQENLQLNYYNYMHLYMGAGVAVADLNNDNLPDIYFTGNIVGNKLYKNTGGMTFQDVTSSSGTDGGVGFYTGVTMGDVNGDNLLDIYVCRSGPTGDISQPNLLYINKGDFVFEEAAAVYGLDDKNHSTQACFFDYDKDGDIDLFLVNTPVDFSMTHNITPMSEIPNLEHIDALGSSDKLYRNDRGYFTDVTAEAGIPKDIFFGLNVSVGDINNDSWPDLYVCNDFAGPDRFFVNNGDGTFSEKSESTFGHTSFFSMGSEMADMNNDGNLDLLVMEMLPDDYKRSKTSMTMTDRNQFREMSEAGYHRQYMHNMYHKNNGHFPDGDTWFSEISQYSGIDKTDWSWSGIAADFDQDGFQDLFVTNGIVRDVTNVDALQNQNTALTQLGQQDFNQNNLDMLRDLFPSVKTKNYFFSNQNGLTFENKSDEWLSTPASFSNGAAVADFDGDGDLDLVCNNVNDEAFLLENTIEQNSTGFLKVKLRGERGNNNGLGARIHVYVNGMHQMREVGRVRGYFSSSDHIVHFGLGGAEIIDSVRVDWPDKRAELLINVPANQFIGFDQLNALRVGEYSKVDTRVLAENRSLLNEIPLYRETEFDDYSKQLLLPHRLSNEGPCIVSSDVNNDGLEDFLVGGSKNVPTSLYVQKGDGSFALKQIPAFREDQAFEDLDAAFVDVDGDDDLDLYLVSGSYEFDQGSNLLQDRLYLNDGQGQFARAKDALPTSTNSGSSVAALDVDGDGDQDLFIGSRVISGKYPFAPTSQLLINNAGIFTDKTAELAPSLQQPGMVTDVLASDFDQDGDQDLILTGEWMPLSFYENNNGQFTNATEKVGLAQSNGWWNTIIEADVNNDGKPDYIAGNLGLNYKFKASVEKPFHIYADDFDNNGTWDILLAKKVAEKQVPVRGRQCTAEQMPFINDKFPTFESFASCDVPSMLGSSLDKALHMEAYCFESSILMNDGNGTFKLVSLPEEVQLSTINAIVWKDLDKDGTKDLLLAGNMFGSEVETSRADAGTGLFLRGISDGDFEPKTVSESGFFASKDVKAMKEVQTAAGLVIVVGSNGSPLQVFSSTKKPG
jgi:hypothetical protein